MLSPDGNENIIINFCIIFTRMLDFKKKISNNLVKKFKLTILSEGE